VKLSQFIYFPSFKRPQVKTSNPDFNLKVEPLFNLWTAYFGLLIFAFYILYVKGIWASLFAADPTYLTALIVVLFIGSTIWVGFRSHHLAWQYEQISKFKELVEKKASKESILQMEQSWIKELFISLVAKKQDWRNNSQLISLFAEKASAAHEMPWWINGVLLKLGLLGKVIGFSIMALQLGSLESFDASQTSNILKTLTGGLGIALLTTMTGLAANMLLGLQLMRLDRFADRLTSLAIENIELDLEGSLA
jgi:hypothetical protein